MSLGKIVVRKAAKEDIVGIINTLQSTKLGDEMWQGNEDHVRTTFKEILDNKDFILLVAEINSVIVGFIDGVVFPSLWEDEKQGLILDFFVAVNYQDKGVGSKLLEELTKNADNKGIVELHVSTQENNVKARRLYGKYGFTTERLLLER